MKKIITILLAAATMTIANSYAADTLYVNGKPVSDKVIDAVIKNFETLNPGFADQIKNPDIRRNFLKAVGAQQAVLLEAKRLHLESTSDYKQVLNQAQPALFAQVMQIRTLKAITDAKVQARYDELKQQAANPPKNYDLSHIVVKDLATATDVIKQLDSGADFGALAAQYSIDTPTKNNKGEIGQMTPELAAVYGADFANAYKGLSVGKYTETPVKLAGNAGYDIIKLNSVTNGTPQQLPDFKTIKANLKQQMAKEQFSKDLAALQAKYKVEVK